jgi:hypothetical protein
VDRIPGMCSECFGRTLGRMSTFTDPQQPESFEHNGQKPEVEVTEADASENLSADSTDDVVPAAGSADSGAEATDEPDSFDENLESGFKEFVGEATPVDGPAPAG